MYRAVVGVVGPLDGGRAQLGRLGDVHCSRALCRDALGTTEYAQQREDLLVDLTLVEASVVVADDPAPEDVLRVVRLPSQHGPILLQNTPSVHHGGGPVLCEGVSEALLDLSTRDDLGVCGTAQEPPGGARSEGHRPHGHSVVLALIGPYQDVSLQGYGRQPAVLL